MLDAYLGVGRFDDAFSAGKTFLEKHPDDVQVLVQLTFAGAEQTKRKNSKYAAASLEYGSRAIDLIEDNKKPPSVADAAWNNAKSMIGQTYQEVSILFLVSGKRAEAKMRLEKAAAINPGDPLNCVLIGTVLNDEYQQVARQYSSMPDSKAKDETLEKANGLLAQVIDAYARAVGLSEGKPLYLQMHDQVLADLTSYYKYRHKGSLDGLQEMIDKFKPQTKPQ